MTSPANVHGVLADQFNVDSILSLPNSSWDRKIAADLIAEMEVHLADKVSTLPEMRRILAVKGYQALRKRIESEIAGKNGQEAFRAMVLAMRSFALERPGLSAATFRSPSTDTPEWRQAFYDLSEIIMRVFSEVGLVGEPAQHALRALRSFVRGFVLNETAGSFLDPLDCQLSYELGIEMLILGFPAFAEPGRQ